jgi:hypothetical protein
MLVFVSLVREAFATHWYPQTFQVRGAAMLDALEAKEAEGWRLADKYLLPDQRRQLREAIQRWQAEHPDQYRVEAVRLSDFTELAARADVRRGGSLLSDVRSATRAADQALLLGDRALFWAKRAPTLVRLQVRLGALEVGTDAMRQLKSTDALIGHGAELVRDVHSLAPLVAETQRLTRELAQVCAQGQTLVASVRTLAAPLLAEREQPVGPPLTLAEVLTGASAGLGENIRGLVERMPDLNEVDALLTRSEGLVRRTLYAAALVGVVWGGGFWLGYYLAHR